MDQQSVEQQASVAQEDSSSAPTPAPPAPPAPPASPPLPLVIFQRGAEAEAESESESEEETVGGSNSDYSSEAESVTYNPSDPPPIPPNTDPNRDVYTFEFARFTENPFLYKWSCNFLNRKLSVDDFKSRLISIVTAKFLDYNNVCHLIVLFCDLKDNFLEAEIFANCWYPGCLHYKFVVSIQKAQSLVKIMANGKCVQHPSRANQATPHLCSFLKELVREEYRCLTAPKRKGQKLKKRSSAAKRAIKISPVQSLALWKTRMEEKKKRAADPDATALQMQQMKLDEDNGGNTNKKTPLQRRNTI